MSTLSITSPGVQINEIDLSLIANPPGTANILAVGFTDQGPTEDLVNVSSITEFESIYGAPTNAAERYLYHSARQILNTSPANLIVSRLPYGQNAGDGYANVYSALVYPISTNSLSYENATSYTLLEPTSIQLTNDQYKAVEQNDINWSANPFATTSVFINVETNIGFTDAINLSGSLLLPPVYVSDLGDLTQNEEFTINPVNSALSGYNVNYYGKYPIYTNVWQFSGSFTDLNYDTNTHKASPLSAVLSHDTDGLYSIGITPVTITTDNVLNSTFVRSTTAYNVNFYLSEVNGAYPSSIFPVDSNNIKYLGETKKIVNYNYITNVASDFNSLSAGGLVVLNQTKRSINNLYEGYYVGICDNSNINPSTDFNAITGVKSVIDQEGNFITIPPNRFSFSLSSGYASFGGVSLSEIMETYPTGYNFGSSQFNDSLILVLFKVQTSTYNQNTVELSYSVGEGYAGSLYQNRTQNNPNGGRPVSFNLDTVVNNNSTNIQVITNPYISNTGNWIGSDGSILKSVRVADEAKNLYPDGAYQSSTDKTSKDVGNIPLKLQNVLNHLQNNDTLKLDFTIEAGLGTIWASANAYSQDSNNYGKPVIYDDTYNYNLGQNDKTLLYDTTGSGQAWSNGPGADYLSIADQFVSLANDTRKDHVFIADPIRHLLVRGANNKVSVNSGFVFSDDIYWPLNNQFSSIESSYVVTYANWLKYNDAFSNQFVWLPSSGYVAAKIATSSQQNFPWSAVAGFTRGVLDNVVDVAINPTQKQRDLLYKVNLNPIAYFPNEGYVIYGQKTLYRLPSAFDRLNVRELFLVLEKTTQSLLKYFVFEPNTFTTQKRLVASLTPVFDNAKINGGLYDYLIVCDSRNNPLDVVDNNELAVAIYIQPVKTAEFILCDFIATQTGVNFNELVANKQF